MKKKNPDNEQIQKFKLVLGNEIYLVRNGLCAENYVPKQDQYFHFILLAKDKIGHKQIREISTRAWRRSYMARNMRRVPTYYQDIIDIIGTNPGHVIGSTACLGGQLPAKILSFYKTNDPNEKAYIYAWCQRMNEIFGKGNFYFEMQPSANCDQKIVNNFLYELSKELDIPYIITTDSHYLKKEDANIHEAYLNSQDGDREVKSFYASTYMMGTEELIGYMTELTSDEVQQGFTNIQEVLDKCEEYSLKKPLKIPQLPWKTFSAPKDLDTWR